MRILLKGGDSHEIETSFVRRGTDDGCKAEACDSKSSVSACGAPDVSISPSRVQQLERQYGELLRFDDKAGA